jgi:hypothetical protein
MKEMRKRERERERQRDRGTEEDKQIDIRMKGQSAKQTDR